jgi:hypothetical protein
VVFFIEIAMSETSAMAEDLRHYRAWIMGWDGHITGALDLPCADDDAAKERAKQLVNGYDVELWQRNRRIAIFERDE